MRIEEVVIGKKYLLIDVEGGQSREFVAIRQLVGTVVTVIDVQKKYGWVRIHANWVVHASELAQLPGGFGRWYKEHK